mgnify:CR=1 FL=1
MKFNRHELWHGLDVSLLRFAIHIFAEEVMKNQIVKEKIGEKEIKKCLKAKNYIGHSSEIVDRVLGSV